MFPILPILILLFLGPANAERLAFEGRLPAAILAVHLAKSAPLRAVAAPVAESPKIAVARASNTDAPFRTLTPISLPRVAAEGGFFPACPPRAGPQVG